MAARVLANGKQQYFDSAGDPLVGGKVYTYEAGTTTPKYTYSASTVSVPNRNANPVILDARGEATIFWDGAYKVVLKDSLDNTIWTVDNISTESSAADVDYGSATLDEILLNNSVYVVEAISDLRSVDKTLFTQCFVQGYYAKGDGGGGLYYYDSGDTTSSDNGGTIIVATDTGRWKLQTFGKPYSVLQFGAKPDGTTNAATAFGNALSALGSNGGVVTVEGCFYIGGNIVMPKNTQLVGLCGPAYVNYDSNYNSSNYESMLIIDSTYKITAKSGCSVKGMLIVEKDVSLLGSYPMPFASDAYATSAVAGYAGYGIYSDDTAAEDWIGGVHLENLTIIGFAYGVLTDFQYTGFINIVNCAADCTNGFYIKSGGYDEAVEDRYSVITSEIKSCFASSFASVSRFSTMLSAPTKTGYGFYLSATDYSTGGVYSHILAKDCSSYSYATGFYAVGDRVNISNAITQSTSTTAIYLNCNYAIVDKCHITQPSTYSIRIGANCVYHYVKNVYLDNTIVGGDVRYESGAGYGVIDGYHVGISRGGNSTALSKSYLINPIGSTSPYTFTPSLQFGGASVGMTYTTQAGAYQLNGNVVTATIHILLSAKGSSTGAATITGLPYTSSAVSGAIGGASVAYYAGMAAITGTIHGDIAASSSTITLYESKITVTAASTAINDTDFTNTSELRLTVTYFIDR